MTRFRDSLTVASVSFALGFALVGCGRAEEPSAGPSSPPPVTVSAEPSSSSAEPGVTLDEASVVVVREYADGDRGLVAYGFASGQTRKLVPLSRDENPAVSADGTQVVVQRANGPLRDDTTNDWLAKSGSHLVLIDLADGEEDVLTDIETGRQVHTPQWNREDGWVYYLVTSRQRPNRLMRVLPETGEVEQVPHGRGITQFVIEPDGRHAWVYAPWRWPDGPTRGGAWRLDLTTGAAELHALQTYIGGEIAWAPDAGRVAITRNTERSDLSVSPWPGKWSPPPESNRWPAHVIYLSPSQWPRHMTFFGDVGWQEDASHVVLASVRARNVDQPDIRHDRWYVSLIDRRTGQRTDITPPGVADTTFDVWWPER